MNYILWELVPVVIIVLSLCVPLAIFMWIRHQHKKRRSPLTADMLRAPGESISRRIDDLDDEVDISFTFTALAPLICYSSYLSSRYVANAPISLAWLGGFAAVFIAFFAFRLYAALRKRVHERLGLDCERAVGQELDQLMLDGYRVYHDYPADDFNIDHVVIGSNGVFAIETKGRAKPRRGKGQEDARVIYDGQSLRFPSWSETDPLDQAERQAAWLSRKLSDAVGDHVAVRPVLALPGWYVERKRPGILIFNGKNPQFLLKMKPEVPLSTEMIQRIAHQVDQQCRDVEPEAYRKK